MGGASAVWELVQLGIALCIGNRPEVRPRAFSGSVLSAPCRIRDISWWVLGQPRISLGGRLGLVAATLFTWCIFGYGASAVFTAVAGVNRFFGCIVEFKSESVGLTEADS